MVTHSTQLQPALQVRAQMVKSLVFFLVHQTATNRQGREAAAAAAVAPGARQSTVLMEQLAAVHAEAEGPTLSASHGPQVRSEAVWL